MGNFLIREDGQMLIFNFVDTKHQVLLICNEYEEIGVAHLMIK